MCKLCHSYIQITCKILLLVLWEFCTEGSDHTHSLSASQIHPSFPICPTSCPFSVKPSKTNLCCPNILGCVAYNWSKADLEKTDSSHNMWLNILFREENNSTLLMFHRLSLLFLHVLIRYPHFFSTQGSSIWVLLLQDLCHLQVISSVCLSTALYRQGNNSLFLVDISFPLTFSYGFTQFPLEHGSLLALAFLYTCNNGLISEFWWVSLSIIQKSCWFYSCLYNRFLNQWWTHGR